VPEEILRKILDPFFAHKIDPLRPDRVRRSGYAQKTDTFIEVLCEETGLIQAEDDQTYVLPHLTFEEYLAACHLAGREDVALAYAQWQGGGERWREALLLLMGRLRRQEKFALAFSWLMLLVAERAGTEAKPALQRQRDALLAVTCYDELGRRAYFAGRPHDVIGFEERLRTALVEALEHPDPALLLARRIEAGDALAGLGDPRYPVTSEEWEVTSEPLRPNLVTRLLSLVTPYWCYVRPGTYRIGGWEARAADAAIALPAFWIARFPVTVAQFAPFVEVGYHDNGKRWWTPNGWQWKEDHGRR
jgi:hypothetical protein